MLSFYDLVLNDERDADEKLRRDWLVMDGGMFLGPWKIRIGDLELWKCIEPLLAKMFTELGHQYPECVWMFYYGDRSLEHPSKDKLQKFT